jgi:hypothetical protein
MVGLALPRASAMVALLHWTALGGNELEFALYNYQLQTKVEKREPDLHGCSC